MEVVKNINNVVEKIKSLMARGKNISNVVGKSRHCATFSYYIEREIDISLGKIK